MEVTKVFQDAAEVVDISGYVGMVSAIGIFIDRKRTLKMFLCRGEVTKVFQDAAEVVDAHGYGRMVSAIRRFSES